MTEQYSIGFDEGEQCGYNKAIDECANELNQLKAQVNCLREVLEQLAKLGNGDKYGNSIGNTIAINALAKTPEQCLAEVKEYNNEKPQQN